MDNNLNNGSGISGVNDIKFDDTPAESFNNLYGQSMNNSGVNQNAGINFNENINSNIGQVGVQPQNFANVGVNHVQSQPVNNIGQSNAGATVNPSLNTNVGSNGISNVSQQNPVTMNNNIGMASNPQIMSNPGMINQVPVEPVSSPSMQPNGGGVVNPVNINSINNGVGVQANPNMNQAPMMTANPVNVSSNGVDLSNVDIDAERMQSIEEQLSKTSQYNPEDLQQEMITISSDNQYEKNKSGLVFVIVLFVILALVIAFLPQITKMIK